jgi:hypothetical protein
MSTCRCGAWAGHPEAPPHCNIPDCELRGSDPLPASDTGAPILTPHPQVGAPGTIDNDSEAGSWARALGRGCLTGRVSDHDDTLGEAA